MHSETRRLKRLKSYSLRNQVRFKVILTLQRTLTPGDASKYRVGAALLWGKTSLRNLKPWQTEKTDTHTSKGNSMPFCLNSTSSSEVIIALETDHEPLQSMMKTPLEVALLETTKDDASATEVWFHHHPEMMMVCPLRCSLHAATDPHQPEGHGRGSLPIWHICFLLHLYCATKILIHCSKCLFRTSYSCP